MYIYSHTRMHARAHLKCLGEISGVSSSHQNTGKSPNKGMFASILPSYHDRTPTFSRPHCWWGHLKTLMYSALNENENERAFHLRVFDDYETIPNLPGDFERARQPTMIHVRACVRACVPGFIWRMF